MAALLKLNPLKLDKIKKQPQDLQYVVAVDDSNCSRHAVSWADCIANQKDKITILHSFETENALKIVKDRYEKYPQSNKERYALTLLEDDRYNLDQRIKHYINKGQKQTVDMLVTGLWGKGFEQNNTKSHIGSTSDLSLRSARCSSMFVRREIAVPENQSELKIMVGVDGSQNSLHAFEFATRLLAPNNSLYIVHVETEYDIINKDIPEVYRSPNVIKNYTKKIEEVQQKLGFKVKMKIESVERTVKISDALCKYAADNNCHILCVGADGMTAHCNKQPILGSVSDECVKKANCNIIVTQINELNSTSTPRGD